MADPSSQAAQPARQGDQMARVEAAHLQARGPQRGKRHARPTGPTVRASFVSALYACPPLLGEHSVCLCEPAETAGQLGRCLPCSKPFSAMHPWPCLLRFRSAPPDGQPVTFLPPLRHPQIPCCSVTRCARCPWWLKTWATWPLRCAHMGSTWRRLGGRWLPSATPVWRRAMAWPKVG